MSAAAADIAAVDRAVAAGTARLVALQEADGAWRADYGGPCFLAPMYVIAHLYAGRDVPAARAAGLVRHLRSTVRADGGVPLHAEGEAGMVFTTALTYVALRCLGVSPDDPQVARMRHWIRATGSPLGAAAWGKWMLALVNLYDYAGVAPLLPELHLLPTWLPIHPSRLWCHARQVYLPAAWLYGTRAARPEDAFTRALRAELYDRPYDDIPFASHMRTVAASDLLQPETAVAGVACAVQRVYERIHPRGLRRRAIERLLEHIDHEDRTTGYHRIGPVNAVLDAVVQVARGATPDVLARSWAGLDAYLHEGPGGISMNGYLSTALWDTAFAAQTLAAVPEPPRESLVRAGEFVRTNQIDAELPERRRFHRDPVRGGWPFCEVVHGWPITDCTAEGMKAALAVAAATGAEPSGDLAAARDFILTYQNRDGGWSTYERCRGAAWLEWFNVSHAFQDIMIDHSFTECTSACVQALAALGRHRPALADRRTRAAIRRGAECLRHRQRRDGSWEGAWAVCFTYGTWFGVRGLLAAGWPRDSAEIGRAAGFLLARQQADGGWGEHQRSCIERRWVPRDDSTAVHTAWALMTLIDCGLAGSLAAARAARFLVARQQPDGDWPVEPMPGVFNRTCCIRYENYRRTFCVQALAEYGSAVADLSIQALSASEGTPAMSATQPSMPPNS